MRIDSRRALPLAAVVAGVTLLAGCGEKEEPSTEGPVVPVTTTTEGGSQGGTQTTTTTTGVNGSNQGKAVSDEKAVQDAIEKFLTSPKAEEVCRDLVTPEFLRRTYGSVAGCKAARKPATLAVSAQISGLRVDGPTAGANAKPNGGVNDDERLTFTLRRSGTAWQIAKLRSNARVGP